ncbi:MAG: hypothetical protein E7319_03700 [Clostridiales bacterium]|nr:hypothetical protein [Clostridiales bacterium]
MPFGFCCMGVMAEGAVWENMPKGEACCPNGEAGKGDAGVDCIMEKMACCSAFGFSGATEKSGISFGAGAGLFLRNPRFCIP